MEKWIERGLVASRWVLAPFYIGLVIALFVVLLKFGQELLHFVAGAYTLTPKQTVLGVLELVDLALLGSLVLIVIFSGYENFVSKIDGAEHLSWPNWMTKVDFAGLKLKLLASIVLISAIELLKGFMQIKDLSDRDLYWLVGVHMVFMVSGVLLAFSDLLQAKAGHPDD
ncbi:TIGR00645 family protein [Labrys sp. LIt4]|uniref:TIGR00645 family protein n=1 Tax=Labrys sp. LIt4 TaxID=2821355 RepID=UPI001ADF7AA9|nr:TIGR00645 family protein [Labrys sp. LIt4]MBP0579830.1 TIGR00645 family protein [Labrys sp. LIt4]